MSSSSASDLPSPFTPEQMASARGFLDFVNASPSQFHAVATTAKQLIGAGFVQVSEKHAEWNIKAGGRYFYTRNQSSIVAFVVGGDWKPGNGFSISAAHTDSPVLKIKPVSKTTRGNYLAIGVEPYGGGQWFTWSDEQTTTPTQHSFLYIIFSRAFVLHVRMLCGAGSIAIWALQAV